MQTDACNGWLKGQESHESSKDWAENIFKFEFPNNTEILMFGRIVF